MSILTSGLRALKGETETPNLAPRPTSLDETGLNDAFVAELIVKHLYEAGVLSLLALVDRIKLPGNLLEEQLAFLRREARVEIRGGTQAGQRYALTDRGRNMALDALMRSGYVGPAPVPLEHYEQLSRAQTVHANVTTRQSMNEAFDGVVLRQSLLDQLGAAMNSARAIFIYGPAGTGKTYITQRLARLLSDTILVPHAISIGEMVVEMFDPVLHKRVDDDQAATSSLALDSGHDPRYVRCERPVAIARNIPRSCSVTRHFALAPESPALVSSSGVPDHRERGQACATRPTRAHALLPCPHAAPGR